MVRNGEKLLEGGKWKISIVIHVNLIHIDEGTNRSKADDLINEREVSTYLIIKAGQK